LFSPKQADIQPESMPTYYFHIRENGALLRDPDGVQLPDLDFARSEFSELIISAIQEIIQEEQMTKESLVDRQFQVEDERGRTVLVVPFFLPSLASESRDDG